MSSGDMPHAADTRSGVDDAHVGCIVEDTLIEAYVMESDKPHDLGSLASRHLGLSTISYDAITGKGASRISFAQVALEQAAEYAAEDADITLPVHRHLAPHLAEEKRLDSLYRDS